MSLLMQALKKAERNKSGAVPEDDDLELADQSFDGVVALTPDDVLSGRVPPAPEPLAFSLEPMEDLRAPAGGVSEQLPALEPAMPAPHDPTPPQSRRHAAPAAPAAPQHDGNAGPHPAGPGVQPLEWTASPAAAQVDLPFTVPPPPLRELALEDVPPPPLEPFVAEMEMARETAQALPTEPIAPLAALEAAALAADALPPSDAPSEPYRAVLDAYANTEAAVPPAPQGLPPAGKRTSARQQAGLAGRPAHQAAERTTGLNPTSRTTVAEAHAPADTALPPPPQPHASPDTAREAVRDAARGTAARARAAAQAAAEQDLPRRDPARVRLAMLGGALALVAGTLAGVYWYALTSPGPGASLPPVPMPPPGAAPGAAPVTVVPPAGALPGAEALPAVATPSGAPAAISAAPPDNGPNALHPAAGYTGLPQAHPAPPSAAAPHAGGSRMPSDDDLQRALQQQPAAAAMPAPAPPRSPKPAAGTPEPNPQDSAAADGTATAIHVQRSTAPPRLNAALQEGYQAFMAGDYASAAQQYAVALRQDPNNRDALLGNATIAARRNDTAAAASGYQRLLELNPADADAQAGLLALRPGDAGHSEVRLKELLRREPGAGPLEFALGNLYAQQGRWPDAQQAYFRAYTAMPDNADYAFNLAVGLDRLSQRKLALTYYQRALDLSRAAPAAFDRNAARRRAEQLSDSAPGKQP